jgi:hypothetical protein
VPSGPARSHVADLERAGYSLHAIAVAADVSHTTVMRLADLPTCLARTSQAILAVTPAGIVASRPATAWVPAVGAQRRVGALRCMGWGTREINAWARAAGLVLDVKRLPRRRQVTRATHEAVCAAYEALWRSAGPNDQVRRRAPGEGHHPPMAWDDDTIDNPSAQPYAPPQKRRGSQRRVELDDVEHLLSFGEPFERIAAQLGVTTGGIEAACTRAGRPDLIDRLRRSRRAS